MRQLRKLRRKLKVKIMIGFIVDTEFVWGFQARIVGLSKTSPSFYYPPPTTFLGALAEVIAKENNIGEDLGRFIINELSRNLLAIGFRPLNCVPIKYEDLNRIIMVRTVGGTIKSPLPTDPYGSFDSPARGKTILASLDDDSPKIRWFLVFKDTTVDINNNDLRIKLDTISLNKKTFWKIHRLGSKESRISVTEVKKLNNVKIVSPREYIITNYSFPTVALGRKSEEKTRKWENEVHIDPYSGKIYDKREGILHKHLKGFEHLRVFKVPIMISNQNPPEYIVKIENGWKAYLVEHEEKEVVIGR